MHGKYKYSNKYRKTKMHFSMFCMEFTFILYFLSYFYTTLTRSYNNCNKPSAISEWSLKTTSTAKVFISFIETRVKEAIMRTQGHQGRLLGPARSINLIHSAPEQSSSPQTQVAVARDVSVFKMKQNGQIIGEMGQHCKVKPVFIFLMSSIARITKRQ